MYYFKSDFKKADEQSVNIFNHPKLKEAESIRKITEAFDDRLKKFFVYGTVKGDTLFLFFNHQIGLLEFNGKKDKYLEKMRAIYKKERLKDVLFFRKVNAQLKLESGKKIDNTKREPDVAEGDFEIKCKNPQLKKMFENIRSIIKESHLEEKDD